MNALPVISGVEAAFVESWMQDVIERIRKVTKDPTKALIDRPARGVAERVNVGGSAKLPDKDRAPQPRAPPSQLRNYHHLL